MKVAVIGNGDISGNHGSFIDSCDKVIRMKQYVTKGYEQCVGTKIDIYASKWFSWFDNFKPYSPKDMSHVMDVDQYWFMFCNPYEQHQCTDAYTREYVKYSLKNDNPKKDGSILKHEEYIKSFNIDIERIEYYPAHLISELSSKLKLPSETIQDKKGIDVIIEPSVGIRVLHKTIHDYPESKIYISGFDCFLKSSWYWDSDHIINNDHKYMNEWIYLRTLIKQGKLTDISDERV